MTEEPAAHPLHPRSLLERFELDFMFAATLIAIAIGVLVVAISGTHVVKTSEIEGNIPLEWSWESEDAESWEDMVREP